MLTTSHSSVREPRTRRPEQPTGATLNSLLKEKKEAAPFEKNQQTHPAASPVRNARKTTLVRVMGNYNCL